MRKIFTLLSLIFIFTNSQAQNRILIPYREGDSWGFCDTIKNIIVKPTYDTVGNFSYSAIYTIVKKENKTGVFSRLSGKEIIKPQYDDIRIPYPGGFNKSNLFYVSKNGKMGIINDKGKIIIDIIYDKIDNNFDRYEENLISHFILKKDNKYGISNKNGKIIIDFKYDSLIPSYQPPSYQPIKEFYGKLDNIEYFIHIDKNENVSSNYIHQEEGEMAVIAGGIASSTNISGKMIEFIAQNNLKNEKVLKKYNLSKIYNDTIPSLTSYNVFSDRRFFKVSKDNKIGILDIDKDTLNLFFFKKKYSEFIKIFSYETENKVFQNIFNFNKIILVKYKKKIGVLNEKENLLFPFKIDSIIESTKSYIIYKKNNFIGLYNYFSSYLPIQPLYTSIRKVDSIELNSNSYRPFDIYIVQKNKKWGYVGINGIEYFSN